MQKGETMSSLKTDYKDDVFTGKRKYTEINNGDGTISFNDVTEYTQTGDTYGATQINEINEVVNTLDSESYKSTDAAETSIADNDYFPFYDTSATKQKKTLFSNLKNVLTNVFAIKTHSSSSTTYGTGSSSLYGHVKLSDNYTSSAGAADAAVGASSKAVFDSFTANKNSITTLSGTVTNLTTQVNTNKSNISNLTTRMTTVESNATTNATNISSLNTKMSTVENELTANSKRIYMDYQNGKYGINTSANRGADTFIPFNSDKVIDLSDYFDITTKNAIASGSLSISAPASTFILAMANGINGDGSATISDLSGSGTITTIIKTTYGNNERGCGAGLFLVTGATVGSLYTMSFNNSCRYSVIACGDLSYNNFIISPSRSENGPTIQGNAFKGNVIAFHAAQNTTASTSTPSQTWSIDTSLASDSNMVEFLNGYAGQGHVKVGCYLLNTIAGNPFAIVTGGNSDIYNQPYVQLGVVI